MPFPIPCPHCDRLLRLPEALYDQPAQCPLCSGAFYVRWRRARPQDPRENSGPAVPMVESERLPCRFCGHLIRAEALKCPNCQRWLNTER